MRYFLAGLLALAAAAPAAADEAGLKDARTRLLRGNYGEARELYEKLAADPAARAAAAVGLSRTWQAEGEYDKALSALDDGLKQAPKNAGLHAARAELLHLRGRWDEAQKAAAAAVAADPEQFLARWVLAQLHRDRGDLKKAGEELLWFVRTYVRRSDEDKEITDPDELLLVGLAACERARWDRQLSDQFQFVLTEIYGHLAKKDKDFWPAEYQKGRLHLEKYNKGSAFKAFSKALAINPRAAEVHAAAGALALQRFEMRDAEHAADQALKVNPNLVEALCLRADIFLAAGDADEALKHLDKARAVNPRSEHALARVAACLYLQRKHDELAALCKEVEKHNAKPYTFYHDLADRLDERKRYGDAEKYYKTAIKLHPRLVSVRNNLGLLYMRLGREGEAYEVLDLAFKDDPFNVRVLNSLKVLDHLKTYKTIETPHFHVRYDPKNDAVLAAFVAKYLEDIYEELAEAFQYRPKGPFVIEVFNKHEMFSGRVVALPDLHTIGATTGRMVAMVSPRDKSGVIGKPFNWNRVMRHELVHVFNLDQTDFQVPHWFTEGLAVSAEKMKMPPRWYEILLDRVPKGELMNLDNIHLGFIRPGGADEWHLAYLQSFQYVEYLKKAHGPKAVGGLLDAYREGLDTGAAIEKVCKVSKAEFEKGYRKHLEGLVRTVAGKAPEKRPGFEELKALHAKDPGNADVAAQLAERYLMLANKQEARKLADAALKARMNHPLAAYVKARLMMAGGEDEAAVKLLEAAVDAKAPEVKVLRLLGKLHFEAKKFDEAAKALELGSAAEPHNNEWLKQLARAYLQSGAKDKLVETLKRLVPTDPDDLDSRRELAQQLLKAGRHAEAESYAREALEIDVLDRESRQALEQALKAQNKDEELKQLRKLYGAS